MEQQTATVSDQSLQRVLIMADNLLREAKIRFKSGTPDSATIGAAASPQDAFCKAVAYACAEEKIPVDRATLNVQLTGTMLETFQSAAGTRRQQADTLRRVLASAAPGTAMTKAPQQG